MAFTGYMIKLKGLNSDPDEELPMDYMAVDSYSATPNQRMEAKANRAVTGLLHRSTVSHTASKIEFETPPCTNKEVAAINALLSGHYSNALERKLQIEYYDPETDTYKTAEVYVPDVQYKISRVDGNTIYYDKIRYAFIEY